MTKRGQYEVSVGDRIIIGHAEVISVNVDLVIVRDPVWQFVAIDCKNPYTRPGAIVSCVAEVYGMKEGRLLTKFSNHILI